MRTALATDPRFRAHAPPGAHSERPERLVAVEHLLDDSGLRARTVPMGARPATPTELARAHRAGYLADLERRLAASSQGWLDPDTYFSAGSWEAALLAAGTSVALAEAVADGSVDNGFALVRPPGHHATPDRAMGFCLLNNVAVAAAALSARGLRVAVCDFDVHHGNGTQDIFYEHPGVLFISSHQYPFYPGTGGVDERGKSAGLGTNLNLPLPSGAGDDLLLAAWEDHALPAVRRFRPDVVLASAGFDAHELDPLAGLRASERGFAHLVHGLLGVSEGRLALVLEGGYDLGGLSSSVGAVLRVLLGEAPPSLPRHPLGPGDARALDAVAASLAALPVPAR